MRLDPAYHSGHIEALKAEVKTKFKHVLDDSYHSFLKKQVEQVINRLTRAIVSVDILRSPDFNYLLSQKKNFYGLKLNALSSTDAHLYAHSSAIKRAMQLSMQVSDKKDMWKLLLANVLIELQDSESNAVDTMLRFGTNYLIPPVKDVANAADVVIVGPRENDFPLLIVDFCRKSDSSPSNRFSPTRLHERMTETLLCHFNNRNHWPLTQLGHISVYGLMIDTATDEFFICRMVMRPEIGPKLAFVYTTGKRFTSRNLFINPTQKPNASVTSTYAQEALAQISRGDSDSTDEEEYDEEDEWITCYSCQTCHHKDYVELDCPLSLNFSNLSIEEIRSQPKKEQKEKQQAKAKAQPENKFINPMPKYKRPHGGSVVAVISLIQTVIQHNKFIKSKDNEYKSRK